MELFLAFVSALIGIAVLAVVGVQARRGTVPIFSARNFFLLGIIIFQVGSALISFATQDYWEAYLGNPVRAGIIFTGSLATFLLLLHITYQRGWLTFGLPQRLMTRFRVPADATILALSVIMGALALVFRFVLIQVPVFGILSALLGSTFAAASASLVCWVWAKRLGNPVFIAFAVCVLGSAFVVATYHAFGRRDLLTVICASVWGAYQSHFRYQPLRRSLVPLSVLGAVGVLLLAAFTASRGSDNMEITQSQMNSRIANADIKAGLIDLMTGQYCAACSMWLIESRPDSYPYDPLHSLRYAVTNIIPRDYYPGTKVIGLGLTMVPEAGMNFGRGEGFTVGPGLIGHIFNDNPWIALPLYALLLGAILHIYDRLLALQPDNPFIVVPLGVALGEFVAIPRGEAGLYAFRSLFGTLAVYIGLVCIAKVMMGAGWKHTPVLDEDPSQPLPDALEVPYESV